MTNLANLILITCVADVTSTVIAVANSALVFRVPEPQPINAP